MALRIGIDIGSTTVKVVVLDAQNKLLFRSYERHYSKTRERTCETLRGLRGLLGGQQVQLLITGSAGLGVAKAAGLDFVQEVYATLALYRLNHNGNCVLCTCILESLKVIVRCIGETISHRSESNLASITRLTCCRHGTKGSSMKSHLCSYDMITVWTILFNTIFTGHFDHCLVSLCT